MEREKKEGREKKKEIGNLYFFRYPWKQMGTNRYLHYPTVTVKEKDVGVYCDEQSFYPVQSIMTSFHLHNFNPSVDLAESLNQRQPWHFQISSSISRIKLISKLASFLF